MPPKTVLQVVAFLVAAAFAVFAATRGHAPASVAEWLAPVAPAVTVAGVGLWVFDRYLWRWRGVSRLVGRPVLHGTWHGQLASSWVDPDTKTRIPSDPDVFLVVRQRYWQVVVRLLTKESSSASMLADLTRQDDGVHQLVYVYANTPRPEVRHRSALHYGAVVLTAPLDPKEGLEGEYFTGRSTTGELRFQRHFSSLIESHSAGRKLVESPAVQQDEDN
jgi:SMODS-associating 2TM, beta-strand rich effector domain